MAERAGKWDSAELQEAAKVMDGLIADGRARCLHPADDRVMHLLRPEFRHRQGDEHLFLLAAIIKLIMGAV